MRYQENARCKFVKNGKVIYGKIVGRIMKGRKTIAVHVMDDQNKLWNLDSTKDLEKA